MREKNWNMYKYSESISGKNLFSIFFLLQFRDKMVSISRNGKPSYLVLLDKVNTDQFVKHNHFWQYNIYYEFRPYEFK